MLKHKTKSFYITCYLSHFLICQLLFLSLFSFLLIYHGPFVKLKENIVAMSMSTNKNKFFATWFLSKNEIDSILARTNPVVKDYKQNLSGVNIQKGNQPDTSTASAKTRTDTQDSINNKNIKIIDITEKDFNGKIIEISDPSKITIGLAPNLGEKGTILSKIVKLYGAIGGINAGGFLNDSVVGGGTGGEPSGIVIDNSEIKFIQKGLNTFDVIGFNKDNILIISNSMNIDQIKSSNLRCAISFGPALIVNGKPLVKNGGTYLAPRSAIAQKKDGTVLLLVIDGRQSSSHGANYLDVQNILLKYGAYNAANLDGGGSTTLNYQGKTINSPSDITGERAIPTAFLIMP
jgi:exopolysaccharide biosynthesis protein